MSTPDIQTPTMMMDIKTVNVQTRVIHTPWSVVREKPFDVYYGYETWVAMQRAQKIINFIKRLKRRYNEKDDVMRYRNILTHFGLM